MFVIIKNQIQQLVLIKKFKSYIYYTYVYYIFKKKYNTFFNLKKSKFCLRICYIKIILILYLIDVCVLINILIAKNNKILFTILYYIYIISILNLYIANSFLDKFDFINNKSKCNYFFVYIKIIFSLYLANAIAIKTIVIFTIKKDKN